MTVGVKNFLTVGVMAVLFIVMAKVIVTKYPIKGITPVIQAV